MIFTTAEDFQTFGRECSRWLDLFGFSDRDISYEHRKLDPDCWAQTDSDQAARTLVFTLNTEVDTDRPEPIEVIALHEVCEGVLAGLDDLAQGRTWDADTWIGERHAVIHRITHLIRRLSDPAEGGPPNAR
jgi:hypothetical protein